MNTKDNAFREAVVYIAKQCLSREDILTNPDKYTCCTIATGVKYRLRHKYEDIIQTVNVRLLSLRGSFIENVEKKAAQYPLPISEQAITRAKSRATFLHTLSGYHTREFCSTQNPETFKQLRKEWLEYVIANY